MFKKEMSAKLERLFGMRKSTFNDPSDSYEQDTLFIMIEDAQCRAAQGKQYARVIGSVTVFSERDKLPYGYFAKRISQGQLRDKRNFFFYDVDTEAMNSPARIQNISERRARFVYLHSAQYDPNQGEMTSVTFEEATI